MSNFKKLFVGAWSLQDYRAINLNDGREFYPLGEEARGHILYTTEGVMSATLLNPSRKIHTADRIRRLDLKKKIEAQGLEQLTGEENSIVLTYLEAAYGFIGYSGTFSADSEKVYHHVLNSFYPNFIGETINRNYLLIDDRLHLTAVGNGLKDELVWRRIDSREVDLNEAG